MEQDDLISQRQTLISYLIMKTDVEDWHAVADAAMDLRELDSIITERNRLSKVREGDERRNRK